jgi:hypothetical protein
MGGRGAAQGGDKQGHCNCEALGRQAGTATLQSRLTWTPIPETQSSAPWPAARQTWKEGHAQESKNRKE